MRAMTPHRRWIFYLCLAAALAACRPAPGPEPTPTPTPGVTLTPYFTLTPMAVETAPEAPLPTPTPPPTHTPTPFLYHIVEGDTLIVIAFRFDLTLADLLAANPGIDPQFLRIGDPLVIPPSGSAVTAGVLPEPASSARPVRPPACYPASDGSLWCFWLIENTGGLPLESLSAQFSLYDSGGSLITAQPGIAPVNVLPAGGQIPIVARFEGSGPAPGQVLADLVSAIPLSPDDPRYLVLDWEYEVLLEETAAGVSGLVKLPGDATTGQVRIGLIAYDESGGVVGVRSLLLDIQGPGELAFSGHVYSLAGGISYVDVWVEAYP